MKTVNTLMLFIAISLSAVAQNGPIDFETGGNGANWTWTVFENDANPALEIIANPDANGANTSATVAKFTALQAGQPWAGCESQHGSDIGTFTLTSSTSTIKIMVWKNVISDVGIKLVDASSGSLGEIKVANTVTGQWEELTFDFASREGIPYDQIVIFPDFDLGGRTGDNVCYFDNIVFGDQSTSNNSPLTAAPTPTADSALVLSMYSDAYTNVDVDTWLTGWSAGVLSDIEIDGNPTKLYQSLNFVGIETTGSNALNIDSLDTFNVDIWTPNMTEFRIKLVDFGADNAYGGGDDVEHEVTYTSPAQEEWISYHISLDDFTGLTTRDHISQLIFSGQPAGSGVLYVDNVYFSETAPEEDTTALAVGELKANSSMVIFPNPAQSKLRVASSEKMQLVQVYNLLGEEVLSTPAIDAKVDFDLSNLAAGTYFVKATSINSITTQKFIKQ